MPWEALSTQGVCFISFSIRDQGIPAVSKYSGTVARAESREAAEPTLPAALLKGADSDWPLLLQAPHDPGLGGQHC